MHKYHKIAKPYLRELLEQKRHEKCLSQSQMAELLEISTRAYSNLATGRSCCGATTVLLLLLLYDPAEIPSLLEEFQERLQQEDTGKEAEQDGCDPHRNL